MVEGGRKGGREGGRGRKGGREREGGREGGRGREGEREGGRIVLIMTGLELTNEMCNRLLTSLSTLTLAYQPVCVVIVQAGYTPRA